jgi:allantoinase
MADFDLIVRRGQVVTPDAVALADVAVADGRVAAVGPSLAGSADDEIDASGLHVLPGAIDAHVHLNEPGRTEWEGIATGSLALAAGGATTFVDMPLNNDPVTLTGRDFDDKVAAAMESSLLDFALWGGLVSGGVGAMRELAERGVTGYKGFMCFSGIDEFPRVDDHTLHEGMKVAADLGLPILLHAENEEITRELTRIARAEGRIDSMRDFLATRPVIAEVEAIQRAILFAEDTGCALHIVHVSSARGVRAVLDGRARGVDVTCETCPQYLLLTEEDLERLGPHAKAGPPPRSADQEQLWTMIADGRIPMVVSDHSPSSPDLKLGRPLMDCWGGLSGCQSTLGLMLEHGHSRRGVSLTTVCRALATNVAERFRLPGKGAIAVGLDADLVLVDLSQRFHLRAEDLRYRHRQSAFLGLAHRGRVVRTLLRGTTVFAEGRPASASGRLLRPTA